MRHHSHRWRVGFYADRSWVSKVIGGEGRGGWAHMTTFVSETEVIDARVGPTKVDGRIIDAGVQRRPAAYLNANEYALVLSFACTQQQHDYGIYLLEQQLEKPYDSLGLARQFIGDTHDVNRDWRDQSAWFCDELGLWVEESIGVIEPLLSPPYADTPGYAAGINMQARGVTIESYRGDWPARQVAGYRKLLAMPRPPEWTPVAA